MFSATLAQASGADENIEPPLAEASSSLTEGKRGRGYGGVPANWIC